MFLISPGLGLRILVPTVAACAVYLLGDLDGWVGLWAYTATTLNMALLFGLSAVAGGGAWVGSTLRRAGVLTMARQTSRSRTWVELRLFAELAVYVVAAVVLVSLLAWLTTARVAATGGPDLPGLAARTAICLAFAAGGYALGRRWPAIIVVPVAVIVPYVAIGTCLYLASDLLPATTPLDDRFTPFSRDVPHVQLIQAGAWVLVTVGVVALLAANRTLAFACTWSAGIAASFLILVGPADRVHVPEAAAPTCVHEARAMVCLPLASSHLARPLAQDVDDVIRALPGLAPDSASWVEEYVEWNAMPQESWQQVSARAAADGFDTTWVPEAVQVGMATQVNHGQVRLALVSRLFAAWTIPGGPPEGATSANEALFRWAVAELDLPTEGDDLHGTLGVEDLEPPTDDHAREMEWFTALSEQERSAFFTEHARAIRSGTLSWSAFGEASE
ncbi:hypothetical protein [Nocardioides daphniae]|uniref:Uncharacterized protein n=1 Tax=Nocardioides daphniae TaxID=402297 RepID=A0A4P7UDG4_9ACTN|nr:hypothetical protein [Nocardioides daphniae]QCC78312.1 hypothetical protein E2C04_15950 [Nocardioides daphniae]GGD13645.1 hypothetical protein GCM10007231_10890 [Nocardioides daphniae]